MNITYGVCGRFHAFPLAAEMERLNVLEQVFCADRAWRAPRGVPPSKFTNRWDLALGARASRSLPLIHIEHRHIERYFDSWLLNRVRRLTPGILHGWNSHVRQTFKGLRGEGWKLCLERSCPHNLFQMELLKSEAERLRLPYQYDRQALDEAVEELYLADIISAPSQYSARSYQDPVLRAKIRVNALGSNYSMRPRFARAKQPVRVLVVGNEFLRKGTHYLVEAFGLIKDVDARLKIRGVVPKEYAERIRDSRIEIVPPVTKAGLDALYRWANVFCLPSIDEGFGLVTLEALAYGLPLVVTENVGAADVLDATVARVVPIRDPRAIEEGIRWAAAADEDQIWHRAGEILRQNSWSISAARQLENVYRA